MKLFLSSLALLALVTGANAKTYELDTAHSSIGFKVRHLVSNTKGEFRDFQGTIEIDPKTNTLTKVVATAKATSINTNNEKRDNHLRSADFFETEKYPELKFVSDSIKMNGNKGEMTGQLTIKNTTKTVTWEVEFGGFAKDPWGNETMTFTANLPKINRKDYGLTWNKALETGGFLVGDDVAVTDEVEAHAKMADVATKPATEKTAEKKPAEKKK